MVFWLDPHDPATYTLDGSNNITAISNKATAVALTVTSDPNRGSAVINGVPAVTYDSTDWLLTTEAAVVAAGQDQLDVTIFCVVSGSADLNRIFAVGDAPIAWPIAPSW